MRPIATDGVALSLCVSCLSVVTFVSPAKWTNRSRCSVWGKFGGTADSHGPKNHVPDQFEIPHGKG